MGPVRQNPIQITVSLFICVCIALCTIVAHNIAQNRPDNFPSCPPDNHHCSDDVYLRERGGEGIVALVDSYRPTIRFLASSCVMPVTRDAVVDKGATTGRLGGPDPPPNFGWTTPNFYVAAGCSARNWVYHSYFVLYNNLGQGIGPPTLRTCLRPW